MRILSSVAFIGSIMLLVSTVAGLEPAAVLAPTDACSLLSSSDIQSALGVAVGAPKPRASKACQWRQPVKTGAAGAIVDVTILDVNRYGIGKAVASSPKFKITPVPGLGDDAYYSATSDGKITDLRVKKGDGAFAVRVWGGEVSAAQSEPKELALAKVIVAKF